MPTQVGEISQPDVLAAALTKTKTELSAAVGMGELSGEAAQIAQNMQKATEGTWRKTMTESRQKLRQGENRISLAKIEGQVRNIGPDSGPNDLRDQASNKLQQLKTFSERGYSSLDKKTQGEVRTKIKNRMVEHPDLPDSLKKTGTKDFNERIAHDPRYRELVQQRTKELTERGDFGAARQRVVDARQKYLDTDQKITDTDTQMTAAGNRKNLLTQQKADFDSGNMKNKIDSLQTKVNQLPNAQQLQTEFNQVYKARNDAQQNLITIRSQLSEPGMSGNRNLLAQEKTLATLVDTHNNTISTRFSDHLQLQQLREEQQQVGVDLQNIDQAIQTLEAKKKQLESDLKTQDQTIHNEQDTYAKIEQEFVQDVQDVEGWAAEQWVDEQVTMYMDAYEPAKNKYVEEIAANEAKEFYENVIDKRWIRDKRVPGLSYSRRTFHAKNILHDFDDIAQNGVVEFLKSDAGGGYTDPEQIKRLESYVGSTIANMRQNITEQYPLVFEPNAMQIEQFRLTNASWLNEAAKKDPELMKSLASYDRGNRGQVDWMLLLLGAASVTNTLLQEASKEDTEE